MSDDPANLLHSEYTSACKRSTCAAAHDARPHCHLMYPFQRTPANNHINFILPETRDPELHDNCYSIGLSVFFMQLFLKSKERLRPALTRMPTVL